MIDINFPILFVQMATFLIATFVLWKTCWKSICAMLLERRERIKKDLELVEQTRQSVERLRQDYEYKLAQMQKEAEGIIASARAEAQSQKDQILKAAQDEARAVRMKADAQIKDEYRHLLQDLYSEVSDLTVLLTEKIVAKSATRELHDKVFNETMKELERVI
jgi:F-type H+-transporting ATPase subunit b